jgi:hypothetical protein
LENDQDIATVFAIEAFALVDHFLFRDKYSSKTKKGTAKITPLRLSSDDKWAAKYFNTKDLYYAERILLA